MSWKSLENWLTGYRKANFHFGPSSTVRQTIAVSSSPRPWIDVFALLEKFNMAVTEGNLNPKSSTQITVQPVPTRNRRYACIIMRTALPANMKTWPDVVSMLVQRRWRWANSETALGRILAFAGLHTGVCLHPPLPHHNILASRSGYF